MGENKENSTKIKSFPQLLEFIETERSNRQVSELAGDIGLSTKTWYNIKNGQPVGKSTRRRLKDYLKQNFGVTFQESGNNIQIVEGNENIIGDRNVISKGFDTLKDKNQITELQSIIIEQAREISELRKRIKVLEIRE